MRVQFAYSKPAALQKGNPVLRVCLPRVRRGVQLGCAAPAAVEVETKVAVADLVEINKDNFHQFIKDESNGLVVVDFYTDWCGPCKLIYPQLCELNQEYGDEVSIVKFNCNAYNKEIGKELKIKVAPTFHLYRAGDKIAEMSGANVDRLKDLISKAK
eukprot:TRINITY_DN7327_c0_g1_i1.p2 TRINITY_DN7327_c0_g1~~TRINITY_DN7327_c0_g1_i1.p2  ORF type:complete len:180 (-),score=17.30 TRINITY_DN7327_c0_g1_i1:342-812(-)